uniref:Cellular tumor antigen p53 n=1 Tax=Ciona savignyi TaxID=51511 RepID=H2ZH73_CIOSA
VMLERPQIGAEYTTVLYKFMCLSSCVGGINRRPLNVVFNLENAEGQIIGRRVVEVRVCSCPGRDRSQEEKRKRSESGSKEATKRPYKSLQGTMNIMQTSAKRKCMMAGGDDQEEFTLKIRGRDKFEMLKKIKEALDIAEVAAQQQMETYREEEPRQNLPSSSTTPPSDIKSSPNLQENPQIASTFTVSNPITPDSQGFSLTPTHSSHPLTATPNLDLPTGNSPYWSVDADMGCDVPDTNQPSTSAGLTQWAEQPNTDCTPRLVRDLSGLSTTSSLSSSQMNSSGRFVTRVTLRQRVTLNQEPTTDFWKPNASEATNGVKVERKDDVESPPITGEESFEFL